MINFYYDKENSLAHNFLISIEKIEIEGILFSSFKEAQLGDKSVISNSVKSEIIFFDYDNLIKYEEKKLLEKNELFYFFTVINLKELNEKKLSFFEKLNENYKGFLGPIFSGVTSEFNIPLLKNAIFKVINLPIVQDLDVIEDKLSSLLSSVGKEKDRLKKLHELLVPLRKVSLEGINIFSKYNAGMSTGSEILDIFKIGNELCVFLSSSSSYASSDFILNLLVDFKEMKKANKENVSKKIVGAQKELKLLDKIPNENLGLTLIFIRLRGNIIYGYNLNSSRIFSSSQGEIIGEKNDLWLNEEIENTYFEKRLVRGEKVFLFSSGLIKNKLELIGDEKIEKIFNSEIEDNPSNLINEIFFKLKESQDGEILKFDSSCVLIEVDKNAIIQV